MRTRSVSYLFLLLMLIAAAETSVAQGTEISEADFWAAFQSSSAATRMSFLRREIEKYEGSRSGQLTYVRTTTTEYSGPGRYHSITETVDGDKKTSEESMLIARRIFCRENSGPWRTTNCWAKPPAPLEDAIEKEFRVEKSDKGTKYFRKTIFLVQERGKPERTRFQSEDILVLNPDMTIKERTITNSSQETGAIQSRQTWKHEYGIKPKPLEAPIK